MFIKKQTNAPKHKQASKTLVFLFALLLLVNPLQVLAEIPGVGWSFSAPPDTNANDPNAYLVTINANNFLDYFMLNQDDFRDANANIPGISYTPTNGVRLTNTDSFFQAGNASLNVRMDLEHDFHIEGHIFLGDASQQGTISNPTNPVDGFDFNWHDYSRYGWYLRTEHIRFYSDPNHPYYHPGANQDGWDRAANHRGQRRLGGDGIVFSFHPNETGTLGYSGNAHGIGGLQSAFGFVFDTWHNHNTNTPGYVVDPPVFGGGFGVYCGKGVPFAGFIMTNNAGLNRTVYMGSGLGGVQQLGNGTPSPYSNIHYTSYNFRRFWGHRVGSLNPTNNHWHHVTFDFDAATTMLTVIYTHSLALYTSGTNIGQPNPTLVASIEGAQQIWVKDVGYLLQDGESYTFSISASTGVAMNNQAFRLREFQFAARTGDVEVNYHPETGFFATDDSNDATAAQLPALFPAFPAGLDTESYTIREEWRVETGLFAPTPRAGAWANWAQRQEFLLNEGWFISHTRLDYIEVPAAGSALINAFSNNMIQPWAYVNFSNTQHIASARANTTIGIHYYFLPSLNTLQVLKVDENENPIEGVVFEIHQGTPVFGDDSTTRVATIITDSDGIARTAVYDTYMYPVQSQQVEALGLATLGPGGATANVNMRNNEADRVAVSLGALPPGNFYLVEVSAPIQFEQPDLDDPVLIPIIIEPYAHTNRVVSLSDVTENNIVHIVNYFDTREIEVTKIWVDGGDYENRPDFIDLQLQQSYLIDDEDDEWTPWVNVNAHPIVRVYNPGDNSEWVILPFTGLRTHNDAGQRIRYQVIELELQAEWSDDFHPPHYGNTQGSDHVIITNTRIGMEPPTRSIEIVKEWDLSNSDVTTHPDFVEVELRANGQLVPPGIIELDASNNWRHLFTQLPVYDNDEIPINYTAYELNVPAGFTAIIGDPIYDQDRSVYVITIVNTPNDEDPTTTRIDVIKVWNMTGNEEIVIPDSIVIELRANGQPLNPPQNLILNEGNNWRGAFTQLPNYDNEGATLIYSVHEIVPQGFTVTYSEALVDGIRTITITNTPTQNGTTPPPDPERTSIAVNKIWNDNNAIAYRPGFIQVQLVRNGEDYRQPAVLNANNQWHYEFTNLYTTGPAIDITLPYITHVYTVRELPVEGFTAEYVWISETEVNIINTPETPPATTTNGTTSNGTTPNGTTSTTTTPNGTTPSNTTPNGTTPSNTTPNSTTPSNTTPSTGTTNTTTPSNTTPNATPPPLTTPGDGEIPPPTTPTATTTSSATTPPPTGNPSSQPAATPPPPTPAPGNDLVYSDGDFIEIDQDNVPRGIWRFDPELGIWVFDPNVPIGTMPQTGDMSTTANSAAPTPTGTNNTTPAVNDAAEIKLKQRRRLFIRRHH
ncbi:MAG: Cna B-type domain-containing protein [Defluviitaleaceae bacterium]|nr:Cna B-type domain-containing protein [Defluviitaleaceae bacterium]